MSVEPLPPRDASIAATGSRAAGGARVASANDRHELIVDHVSRTFGGLRAVSDFSLRVSTGELVGLIGPNGAGKTTAFNVITGVYAPTTGTVCLDGKRIDGLPPVKINHAGIARTFQNIRLFQNLTVLDNVIVGLTRSAERGLTSCICRTPRFARERDRDDVGAPEEIGA